MASTTPSEVKDTPGLYLFFSFNQAARNNYAQMSVKSMKAMLTPIGVYVYMQNHTNMIYNIIMML